VIFAAEVLRLIGCVELLRVSIARFLALEGPVVLGSACIVSVSHVRYRAEMTSANGLFNRRTLPSLPSSWSSTRAQQRFRTISPLF
jgi:hypothetical protein